MLQKYGSTNKLGTYAKATQVEKYLDALKNAKNSTQSNQFIFNK
jgi:inorganic pyrophosphatase/exopolyphosphatase